MIKNNESSKTSNAVNGATALVVVRVVQISGNAALVEWPTDDGPERAIIPHEELTLLRAGSDEAHTSESVLDAGIPYGVAWSSALPARDVTPQAIERKLHEVGIWTANDLLSKPDAALGALQSVYGLDLQKLVDFARKEAKQNG